jgi:hypothetical protein
MGASLSSIFLVYTGQSITQVFFVTVAAFGGLSLFGYTTKKDLSGWGSFLIMGVIGIVTASLVNLFLQSGALQFAISVIGVLVFAGLTAYDTQQIKDGYLLRDGRRHGDRQGRHHGRPQPLPRLHQHVRHDAAAVWEAASADRLTGAGRALTLDVGDLATYRDDMWLYLPVCGVRLPWSPSSLGSLFTISRNRRRRASCHSCRMGCPSC